MLLVTWDDIGLRRGLESGEVVLAGGRTGYDEHERENGGHVLGLLSVGCGAHARRTTANPRSRITGDSAPVTTPRSSSDSRAASPPTGLSPTHRV